MQCSIPGSLLVCALLALQAWRSEALGAWRSSSQHARIEDDPTPTVGRRRDVEQSLAFLFENMPRKDADTLTRSFIKHNVKLALQARYQTSWAKAVPWDVFLNFVLPYANLDEPREDWRSMFYERFAGFVANATSTLDAALQLNNNIWSIWGIHFVSEQTPKIMSPSQVIEYGYASCTGLAIFFVDACRSVGIPARVVGIPSWGGHNASEVLGNHDWIEVWQDGGWSFGGPIELGGPETWNTSWFFPEPANRSIAGSPLHAIYGASFKRTGALFPLAWRDKYKSHVPGVDITQRYLDMAAAAAAQRQEQQQQP